MDSVNPTEVFLYVDGECNPGHNQAWQIFAWYETTNQVWARYKGRIIGTLS